MYTILWLVFNIASARNARVGRLARRQDNLVQNDQSAKSGNDYDYYRIHQQRNQFQDASGSKLHRKHAAYGDLARNEYNDRLRNYDGLHGERAHLSVKDASHNAAQLDDLAQDYYDYAQYYADFEADWVDNFNWVDQLLRVISINVAGINNAAFEYLLPHSAFQQAIDGGMQALAIPTTSMKLIDIIPLEIWKKDLKLKAVGTEATAWAALYHYLETATFADLITDAYEITDPSVERKESNVKLFGLNRETHYSPLKNYPELSNKNAFRNCRRDLERALKSGENPFDVWNKRWDKMFEDETPFKTPAKKAKKAKTIMHNPSKLTEELKWGDKDKWLEDVALQRFAFLKMLLKVYDRLIWNQMFEYLKGKTPKEVTAALKVFEGSPETINRKKELVLTLAKLHSVTFVQEYVKGPGDVEELQRKLGSNYMVYHSESHEETHLIIVRNNVALYGNHVGTYRVPVVTDSNELADGEGFYVEYEKIIFGTLHASGKDPKTCANWLKFAIESEKMFIVGADCNENIFDITAKNTLVPKEKRNTYLHEFNLVIAPASDLPTVSKQRSHCQYQWLKAGELDTGAKDAIFAHRKYLDESYTPEKTETGIFYVEAKTGAETETQLTQITSKKQVYTTGEEGKQYKILLPTAAFPFDHFMIRTVMKLKPDALIQPSVERPTKLERAIGKVKDAINGVEGKAKKAACLNQMTSKSITELCQVAIPAAGAHKEYENYNRFEQRNDEEIEDDETYKLLKAMYFEGVRDGKRQEWKHLYSRKTASKRRSYLN